MDAGIVSQNIALFCAGNDMFTRPRAGMPQDELRKILNSDSAIEFDNVGFDTLKRINYSV